LPSFGTATIETSAAPNDPAIQRPLGLSARAEAVSMSATSPFNPLSATVLNIAYRRLCPAWPDAATDPAPSVKARAVIPVDRAAILRLFPLDPLPL
jgi:hypothetical protein